MSNKENDVKILMSKKSDSAKLKELSKKSGQHINVTTGIDDETLTNALKKKVQMEQLERELKELDSQYQGLRDELLQQVSLIQTSELDSVEYVGDGKRLYKYPKNSKSGKYNEHELKELAKKKKVYGKIFKKTVVVDETELIKALQQGKITAEEFREITIQQISPVLEIKFVDTDKDNE
jgi:hypothetical protein